MSKDRFQEEGLSTSNIAPLQESIRDRSSSLLRVSPPKEISDLRKKARTLANAAVLLGFGSLGGYGAYRGVGKLRRIKNLRKLANQVLDNAPDLAENLGLGGWLSESGLKQKISSLMTRGIISDKDFAEAFLSPKDFSKFKEALVKQRLTGKPSKEAESLRKKLEAIKHRLGIGYVQVRVPSETNLASSESIQERMEASLSSQLQEALGRNNPRIRETLKSYRSWSDGHQLDDEDIEFLIEQGVPDYPEHLSDMAMGRGYSLYVDRFGDLLDRTLRGETLDYDEIFRPLKKKRKGSNKFNK